jgi:hypothetical protein
MSVPRGPRRRVLVASMVGLSLLGSACGRRNTPAATTTAPSTSGVTTAPATAPATSPATGPATVAPTTTLDVAAAKAAITANWQRFFLPTTSIPDRVALLENGASLQQALEERAKDPLMQQASAVVKQVDLTAADRATVTYDVLLNGTVALADSQGVAVLQDGVWKVGADSFCALISLGATGPIPGCS